MPSSEIVEVHHGLAGEGDGDLDFLGFQRIDRIGRSRHVAAVGREPNHVDEQTLAAAGLIPHHRDSGHRAGNGGPLQGREQTREPHREIVGTGKRELRHAPIEPVRSRLGIGLGGPVREPQIRDGGPEQGGRRRIVTGGVEHRAVGPHERAFRDCQKRADSRPVPTGRHGPDEPIGRVAIDRHRLAVPILAPLEEHRIGREGAADGRLAQGENPRGALSVP